jgi:hypothetical protein
VYIFYTKIIDVELPKIDAIKDKRQSGFQGLMQKTSAESNDEVLDIEHNKDCLRYTVHSTIMRFEDLKLLAEILKKRPIVEQGASKMQLVINSVDEKKFDDL